MIMMLPQACVAALLARGVHAHRLRADEIVWEVSTCCCRDESECSCSFADSDDVHDFPRAPLLMATSQLLAPPSEADSNADAALAVLEALLESREACRDLNFWHGALPLPTPLMVCVRGAARSRRHLARRVARLLVSKGANPFLLVSAFQRLYL